MWDRPRRLHTRRDDDRERRRRIIGDVVAYPAPTGVDPPEAFDVVLKRKRLVVAAVEGRLVDGVLRPTDRGREALAALAQATDGAAYDRVVVPDPAAASQCIIEALSQAADGAAIAFMGSDLAVIGAIKRHLNIRWDFMLAERARGGDGDDALAE